MNEKAPDTLLSVNENMEQPHCRVSAGKGHSHSRVQLEEVMRVASMRMCIAYLLRCVNTVMEIEHHVLVRGGACKL